VEKIRWRGKFSYYLKRDWSVVPGLARYTPLSSDWTSGGASVLLLLEGLRWGAGVHAPQRVHGCVQVVPVVRDVDQPVPGVIPLMNVAAVMAAGALVAGSHGYCHRQEFHERALPMDHSMGVAAPWVWNHFLLQKRM